MASSRSMRARKACWRKSGVVSITTFCPPRDSNREGRNLLSWKSREVHTPQWQPGDGTPMEVPEPSTVSFIGSCFDSADIRKNGVVWQNPSWEMRPENISEKSRHFGMKPGRQVINACCRPSLVARLWRPALPTPDSLPDRSSSVCRADRAANFLLRAPGVLWFFPAARQACRSIHALLRDRSPAGRCGGLRRHPAPWRHCSQSCESDFQTRVKLWVRPREAERSLPAPALLALQDGAPLPVALRVLLCALLRLLRLDEFRPQP